MEYKQGAKKNREHLIIKANRTLFSTANQKKNTLTFHYQIEENKGS
jgi:hypothetical protein